METVNYLTITSDNKTTDLTDKYLAQLHQGAKPSTHQNARELRHRETEAEQKLWALLRNRQLKGKKFRRQHAIANYVVDFYCNESKLAIELDGNFHTKPEVKEYDDSRTASLNETGITVLRFWNEEVISDPSKVLLKISEYLL
jgi:very-short-patch-repair endonuclease